MRLKIGISTCPNDTFMFDALVNQKIDTETFEFDVVLNDVEYLNKQAFSAELDISKISYHAFAYISDKYKLLTSGSALGHKNGPLLISKKKVYPDEVNDLKIAIPGKYTTANLLLGVAYPEAQNKYEYLFSDIEDVVDSGETDAGLIIHENRFTYQKKGLKKIVDLGEYWEHKTKLPIPLGGIIIRRSIKEEIKQKFNRVLKRSIEYAFMHPDESYGYIKKYAQELDKSVIKKHINLYVNNYSIDIGTEGMNAVRELYRISSENNLIDLQENDIFVE